MQQECSVQSTTNISLLCLQHCSMQLVHKPGDKGARIWGLWSTANTARGPMSMLGQVCLG